MTTPTRRTIRRRSILGFAPVLVVLASLGLPSPAQAASSWQWEYDWNLRCYRGASMDANGNGRPETIWFDSDGDCRLDAVTYDANGSDNLLEWMWFDAGSDGSWNVVFGDNDQRIGFDRYWVDRDGNGSWEAYGALTANEPITSFLTGYITAPSNPGGWYSYFNTMAGITGTATY